MVFRIHPTFYDSLFTFPFTRATEYPRDHYKRYRYPPTIEPSYTYRRGSDATYLEVELPGVARDHVVVEVEDSKLIIKGKRFKLYPGTCCVAEKEKNDKKEAVVAAKYLLVLGLGGSVYADGVKADHCGNGVLVVTIPRKAKEVRKVELGA